MCFVVSMRISFNPQNFKGYSNLIYDDKIKNNKRFTMLSMKLDNEGVDENKFRYNDLENFREFKRMYNMSDRKAEDDVLTILYDKDYNKKTSTLYVLDEPLFWGYELKDLQHRFPEEDYKIAEKSHMKIYTLLSSLMNRIMKEPFINADWNYDRVKISTRNNLFAVVSDFSAAQKFVRDAVENPSTEPDIIAEILNRKIVKTMERFFK